MARLSEQGIRLSSMSPSFLSSNSTSHTWPFSAVAELIDNATDPGVSAKQIWIDVVKEGDQLVLTFTDNGNGMTPSKLHKMLSFGFTDKGTGKASQHAIGLYGNGFKSGSMRLGRDTLIFTKNGGCQSVGLLSQTYLQNIKAQAVIVPIVPFNQQTNSLVVTEDSEASLAAILQHSIINSQEQILAHFDSIPGKKGTKILIWNIRRAKDGRTEIDFDSDPTDFCLPVIQIEELKQGLRNSGSLKSEQNVPDMFYSLRAYISILYLKPRTQVILRGKKILAKLVSKSLSHIEHDVYKPQFSKEKVKVTFGLNLRRKEHYGIMMYHKNRLIKAYEKVGCQLKASGQRGGVSVIGVIECNFLKPAHNKQDFEYTKEYRLTLGALGLKLNDYWKEVTEKRTREREFWALEKNDSEIEESSDMDFIWLQCEDCLKWRSIPADHYKVAPETWNCSQNPNPHYRSCSSPEETEESEELLTPSYQKNHKKLEQPKSRKKEKPVEEVWLLEETTTSRSPSESWQPASPTTHRPEHEVSTVQSDEQQQRLKPDEASAHVEAEARTNHEAQTPSVTRSDEHTAERETESEQIKTHEENESRTEDGESSEKKDEGEEKEEQEEQQHMDTLRHKRKPEFLFNYEVKKRWKEQRSVSEGAAEDLHPGKQTSIFKKDSSSLVEKSNPLHQSSTSTTWTYSPLATQTVVVTPLSRTEGTPNRRQLSPDGGDREAKVQKLAFLEREAQRLRSLLGLEVTKTTRGTMTATEDLTEKETTASTTSSDVGCQIVTEECSTSTTDLAAELQSRLKKEKSESPSKTRESDGDTCDDGRLTQQSLHAIRHNVVVLLTALLPQLDLAGISLDTADIDNILQQIIEVNSLKL